MRLPKMTAAQSLDSPSGWFYGGVVCAGQQSVGGVSDVGCLLRKGINVLYCTNCLCASYDCFAARS